MTQTQAYIVTKYDHTLMTESTVGVAFDKAAAAEAIELAWAQLEAEEIELDPEELIEDWREELVSKGVSPEEAARLTPPPALVPEARAEAARQLRERYSIRASYPVRVFA